MGNNAKVKNSKISNIQFFLSILIVMIHSSTLFVNLPGKETQYLFGRNYSAFIQLLISEGICRIAVPLFLVISGFLYFKSFDGTWQSYLDKNKKRLFSLVVPYLFWSSAVFFIFFIAQKIPALGGYFTTRNIDTLSLGALIDNIVLTSYNSPLWYLRYLIVFSLLSIVIYQIAKKLPVFLVLTTFIVWFFADHFLAVPFRTDAVFFYCLGAVIAIHREKLCTVGEILSGKVKYAVALLWGIVLLIRSAYFCTLDPDILLMGKYDAVASLLGNLGIVLGMVCVWYCFDSLFNTERIFRLSEYSMFLFVTHHPIVNTLKKIILKLIGTVNEFTALVVYFVSAALTIAIIVLMGMLIKKYLPAVWKITTGGR